MHLLPMDTMRQIGSFGYLPLSKETLLEIQVSNFINDFLFSGVEDCKAAVPSRCIEVEKPKPLRAGLAAQSKRGHAVDENFLMPIPCTRRVEDDMAEQNTQAVTGAIATLMSARKDGIWNACKGMAESCRSTDGRGSDRSVLLEEIRIDVNQPERRCSNPEAEPGTKVCNIPTSSIPNEGSSECGSDRELGMAWPLDDEAIAMEGERKKANCTQLSRMETFPCKNQVQRERQLFRNDCEAAEAEIKPSGRKPPRPPRSARLSSHGLCTGLIRCASDTNLLLQVSRKAKLERKRKLAAANSSSSSITSMWALIFTLCFVVVMLIGQGVVPQARQIPAETSNAFSPANPYTFPTKVEITASASEVIPLGAVSSSFDTSAKLVSKGGVGREIQKLALHIRKSVDQSHGHAPATLVP